MVHSANTKNLVQNKFRRSLPPTLRLLWKQEITHSATLGWKDGVTEIVKLLKIPHIQETDTNIPEDSPADLTTEMRSLFKRNRLKTIFKNRARRLPEVIHSSSPSKVSTESTDPSKTHSSQPGPSTSRKSFVRNQDKTLVPVCGECKLVLCTGIEMPTSNFSTCESY